MRIRFSKEVKTAVHSRSLLKNGYWKESRLCLKVSHGFAVYNKLERGVKKTTIMRQVSQSQVFLHGLRKFFSLKTDTGFRTRNKCFG
ncbi:hypothetical protein CDAR_439041 [Caerostris darwini]|uniref:Ribosomal protein L20 n=1 Tax=Caerostris darwini TaxID=1538125 RepID=A0AAV4MHM4_9ARAC|nr:hypothetical protein CDAR_439041 [Caerostris darwini]